jgi:hypothetical protein
VFVAKRIAQRQYPATMGSISPVVLLFGDVTDPWVDGIDYVFGQAKQKPWLRSFLGDLFSVFKAETKAMDRVLQENLANCSSLQELAEKYRHTGDEFRMAGAMLIYAVRAALLLECVFIYFPCLDFPTNCSKDCYARAVIARPKWCQT